METCDMMDCGKRGWHKIDMQNFGDSFWMRVRSCSEHLMDFVPEFKTEFSEVKVDDEYKS